jgi:spore germination protein KA
MEKLSSCLNDNQTAIKKLLPAEDVLTFAFESSDGVKCLLFYTDGMVNKQLLGELVAKPLQEIALPEGEGLKDAVIFACRFPEIKELTTFDECVKEILDGNTLLLVDGLATAFGIGAKNLPVRSVTEPPTDIAVKGPREGFIEDIKTNMALVRKRLKTPDLRFETLRVGRRSDTAVVLCYLAGITDEKVKRDVAEKIQKMDIDNVPDSSYIAGMLSPRRRSLFHSVGTTEKPDIFSAKISEGRVGILVDGSPIALTVPFLLTENSRAKN